ncbi:cobalamin biosynthesis protein CobD/CbiB [Colwellia sp. 20A7]|uniref:cobalamin biosynthesis protein CobD/CbiB n=1 Tax=Colwellia sp. 20A7 TaxID=2689569 RepID=UPI00135A0B88|nr:cobalamin biosynthesis protein [Colwellia sp. 20A7]
MTNLSELSSFSYQLLILLTVIFSKAFVSHFIYHEPLRFFQFYCQKLSDKVNNPTNSPNQQTIAGLVAIVVTLPPIIITLWLFESFVEVDFLWQVLLLYIALDSFGITKVSKDIAQALTAKQNYVAKQTLKPWVLRETEPLSSLGLSKACIEMQLLRTLQQGYTVAFIFITLGPLMALCYRLLLEMHYCWNTKLTIHKYFGLYSKYLVNLIMWLPVRIFSLLLLFSSIGNNLILFWRLSRKHLFQLNNNVALLLLSLNLSIKLGGVAMYDDKKNSPEKLRKISFNDKARQPQIADIIHATKKINNMILVSLFLMIFVAVAIEYIASNI